MNPRRLSRRLFGSLETAPAVDAAQVAVLAEQGWSDYTRGRLGHVVAVLPQLITTAQHLEDLNVPGRERQVWAVSARVHHLAATTLSKIGEADLAWIAAERAMQSADRADDPLVLASAARAGTHALLAVGRYADAMSLGLRAAEWLRPQVGANDPEALTLFGMLHLRTAIAAGRRQDRAAATELLALAGETASALGRDANYWQTGFGPTNVMLHRLSVALDLGDVSFVVEHGVQPMPEELPIERRVSHLIDVGRAQSLTAADDDALDSLLSAERAAPQLVHHRPGVRETVRAMHRRSPATTAIAELATRCRAV